MADIDRLTEDLDYVRSVLERRDPTPVSILLLWALLSGVGFALVDLAPTLTGWYWMIAGPGGFVVSVLLGKAEADRVGHRDRRGGLLWMGHWGALLVAVAVLMGLAWAGLLAVTALPYAILLVLALAYLLAAVHLDPRLYWVAGAFAASLPVTLVMDRWGWSVAGMLVAASLLLAAFHGRDPRLA